MIVVLALGGIVAYAAHRKLARIIKDAQQGLEGP